MFIFMMWILQPHHLQLTSTHRMTGPLKTFFWLKFEIISQFSKELFTKAHFKDTWNTIFHGSISAKFNPLNGWFSACLSMVNPQHVLTQLKKTHQSAPQFFLSLSFVKVLVLFAVLSWSIILCVFCNILCLKLDILLP